MTVRLLPVPRLDTLDAPSGWMYEGIHRILQAYLLHLHGNTDGLPAVDALRAHAARSGAIDITYFVAAQADDTAESVVGYARVDLPLRANLTTAVIMAVVHPDRRRAGIGTQLADRAEQTAADRGRTSWITEAECREPAPGEPTLTVAGGDPVPASEPGLIFTLARGYTLRQVARRSRLDLPVPEDTLTPLCDEASERAGTYRLHQWQGLPPAEWLPKIAALTTAMSTDPPLGDLTMEEDPWDADRVREVIEHRLSQGRDALTTAAEDPATGDLVAVTDIDILGRDRADADQGDTIVRQDHRGHHLGMAIKIANLRQLRELYPGVQRLYTWNASENAHMLAINTALGFYPASGSATLQRGDK